MNSHIEPLSTNRLFPGAGPIAFGIALAAIAFHGAASAANLVNNGDFANVGNVFVENVGLGGDDLLTTGGTSIPGWTNVTPSGAPAKYVNEMWVEPSNEFGLTASPNNGSGYFVDLTGEANEKPYGGLEQKIVTTAGTGYTLTFALGASTVYNGSGSTAAALTASATGTAQLASKLYSLTPSSTNQWATETLTFIADSDSTTIAFLADSNNTSRYVGLDDVTLTTRLLPTTVSLTASTTSPSAGKAISLTSLVKPSEGTVTPTGTVTFKSGTQTLGSAALNATGQATLTTSALAVGQDAVTAVYSGDSLHASSTSSAVAITVTGAAIMDLSTTSLAFGSQAAGTASSAKTVTLTNGGTGSVTLTTIALSGEADDFTLSKTCGSSLASKARCTVSIAFKPVSTGTKSATLTITDNATGSPQTVSLGGTGITASSSAAITLSTTSLAFGSQSAGTSSTAKTITLSNSGTAALTLTAIAVTGGEADDFASTTTCGSSLAAKATCTVSVTFKPVSQGNKSASLSITDNASGSPQKVALSGTGTMTLADAGLGRWHQN